MSEGIALATAFARDAPEGAARALEDLSPESGALFLAELAPDVAAGVLEHLPPGSAARRIAMMETSTASALLVALDGRNRAAILRACANDLRQTLLSKLPARMTQQFRRSLAYTIDTVGAWIDYEVATLPAHRTAAEAVAYLRERRRSSDVQLFVVRAGHTYAGVIATPSLMAAPGDMPLSRLADRRVRPLVDTDELEEVGDYADWDEWAWLAVTAPDGSLLGGLSRAGLRRGLREVFPLAPTSMPDSLVAHLATAYLRTGAELLRLFIGGSRRAVLGRSRHER